MYGKRGVECVKRVVECVKRVGMYGKRGVECGKRVGMVVWVPIMLLFLHGATVYVRNIGSICLRNEKMFFFNKNILFY